MKVIPDRLQRRVRQPPAASPRPHRRSSGASWASHRGPCPPSFALACCLGLRSAAGSGCPPLTTGRGPPPGGSGTAALSLMVKPTHQTHDQGPPAPVCDRAIRLWRLGRRLRLNHSRARVQVRPVECPAGSGSESNVQCSSDGGRPGYHGHFQTSSSPWQLGWQARSRRGTDLDSESLA
jgi:hypothetical protein